MTAQANRPPDDRLEERLEAAFDRAARRAEAELADGRMVAEALDRGRRRRGAPVVRSGLVLAIIAALGLGTLWAIGSRPTPAPSPSAPVAVPSSGSPAPTTDGESQVPVQSFGTQTPVLPGGATLPPTIEGQPVYAVGGPAERQIAASADGTPFYISGWYLPLDRGGCGFEPMGSLTPDGVSFADCARLPLFAAPDGGASVQLLFSATDPSFDWAALQVAQIYVHQVVLRVHTHHPGCAGDQCAAPVTDQVAVARDPVVNPALIAATPPPTVSIALAIANGYDYAKPMITGIGERPVLLSASFGTAVVLGDANVNDDPLTWEWRVQFVSSDSTQLITIWEDTRGVSNHMDSRSGGPYTMP